MQIGFIGLGIMGQPMALNVLKAGYDLVVYNRSQPGIDALAAGAAILGEQALTIADSPQALAAQVDVVLSCVSDSPDVEAIVLGEQGILAGAKPGLLYIDFSTIAPATARHVYAALKAKGVDALDAPVSGGDIGAQQGTLSIMVGGDAAAFARSQPLLAVLGKNIVHVGEAGAGQVAKACNQIVISLTIQGVAEALLFAQRSGVDPAKVREALLGGFAYSRILERHGQRMLDHQFQPGFKLGLHRKDLNIVAQTAREQNIPLMGTAQVTALMDALLAQGYGDLDGSVLIQLYERLIAD
jgi:2-hydroxy-3-oxopropionate reductase